MTQYNSSILDKELNRRSETINDFRRNQAGLWCCIDTLITSSLTPIQNATRCLNLDIRAITIIMLWHTLWDYLVDSAFLFIINKLDQGYAALRMATELAHDCARIGENEKNFELWNNRKQMHQTEEYKKIFRFNKKNSFENQVYKLYNLASDYGIHSFQTTDMYLKACGEIPENDLVILKPSETAVYDGLKSWFISFLALHMCCIQALPENVRTHIKKEVSFFWNFFEKVDDVIKDIVIPKISDLKKEENQSNTKS